MQTYTETPLGTFRPFHLDLGLLGPRCLQNADFSLPVGQKWGRSQNCWHPVNGRGGEKRVYVYVHVEMPLTPILLISAPT